MQMLPTCILSPLSVSSSASPYAYIFCCCAANSPCVCPHLFLPPFLSLCSARWLSVCQFAAAAAASAVSLVCVLSVLHLIFIRFYFPFLLRFFPSFFPSFFPCCCAHFSCFPMPAVSSSSGGRGKLKMRLRLKLHDKRIAKCCMFSSSSSSSTP